MAAVLAVSTRLGAQSDEEQRVRDSMMIFTEIMSAPDRAIPTSVLAKAEGIAVFPGTRKDGVAVGGQRGGGVLSARIASTRGWSAPAFITLTRVGVGVQAGAQADDIVLIIVNRRALQNVVSRNTKMGPGTGVAPGPVGRDTSVSTEAETRADIFGYTRSQGVFAGVGLNGASVRADRDANQRFYGRTLRTADVVFRGMAGGTGLVSEWKDLLARYAR